MSKMRYGLHVLLLCMFVLGCQDKRPATGDGVVWKIDPNEAKDTDLSEFVDSIFLVPLETLDECLIKNVTTLTYTGHKFYVNNSRSGIQVYGSNGKFLYSTEKHRGPGPNEYRTALSFNVLANDTLEILDVPIFKLRKYVFPEGVVYSSGLPRELLSVESCTRLNNDTLIFCGKEDEKSALKYYSQSKKRILKTIKDSQNKISIRTSDPLYQLNGKFYHSATYPSNELYVLDENMEKKLVLQLDFGRYNFSMEDLPENYDMRSFFKDWESDDRAYPFTKYVLDDLYIAFFQRNGDFYVAVKDKATNVTKVYRNRVKARQQMMVPHYVCGDSLLHASEPFFLPYLIDTTLMRKPDIARLDSVDEMDNPIIIIYKLKHS